MLTEPSAIGYRVPMRFVVLCGQADTAPDRIVGPFESQSDAQRFATGEPGAPERYAAVEQLTSPPASVVTTDPSSLHESVSATRDDGRLAEAVEIGTSVLGSREHPEAPR